MSNIVLEKGYQVALTSFFFRYIFIYFTSFAMADCIPARQVIPFIHSGHYTRVHSTGDYFIYTSGGRNPNGLKGEVMVVDIRDPNNPKVFETLWKAETFLVESAQGTTDLVASPNYSVRGTFANAVMEFYSFNDVVANKQQRLIFADKEFGEYYHSSAVLPESSPQRKIVRTLLYSGMKYREHEFEMGSDGRVVSTTVAKTGKLCSNVFGTPPPPSTETAKAYEEQLKQNEPLYKEIGKIEKVIFARNSSPEEVSVGKTKREEIYEQIRKNKLAADIILFGPRYGELMVEIGRLKSDEEKLERVFLEESKGYQANLNKATKALREIRFEIADTDAYIKLREQSAQAIGPQKGKYLEAMKSMLMGSARYREALESREKARSEYFSFQDSSDSYRAWKSNSAQLEEANSEMWTIRGGRQISNPVLSKDGQFVAGLVGSKIELYSIGSNGDCKKEGSTGVRGSKVSFSYPEPGKLPKVAFVGEGGASDRFGRGVHIYDFETKNLKVITGDPADGNSGRYYPGFTKDGRVLYSDETGMVMVDPNQSDGATANCIKKSVSDGSKILQPSRGKTSKGAR